MTTRARRRRLAGERGAALLIALGGLALIAALAASALSLTTAPAARAVAAIEQAQATRAAEAAIHRLAAAMARRDLRALAQMDGAVITTTFFGAKIDFSGQDVAGLIDLNTASEGALARLAAFGADAAPGEGADIAAAWVDARSAAGDARSGFETPEDALEALPQALRPAGRQAIAHATVWSGRAAVDPWTATAPAFAAAADVSLEAAQVFVAARALDGRRAALPDGADLGALAASDRTAARISVRATTPGGGRASVSAVLRASSSARAPVAILSWR